MNPYDCESRTADVGGAALTFTLDCLPTGPDRPHDYVVRVHRTAGASTTLIYVQAHSDETRARADANRVWTKHTA